MAASVSKRFWKQRYFSSVSGSLDLPRIYNILAPVERFEAPLLARSARDLGGGGNQKQIVNRLQVPASGAQVSDFLAFCGVFSEFDVCRIFKLQTLFQNQQKHHLLPPGVGNPSGPENECKIQALGPQGRNVGWSQRRRVAQATPLADRENPAPCFGGGRGGKTKQYAMHSNQHPPSPPSYYLPFSGQTNSLPGPIAHSPPPITLFAFQRSNQ